MRNRFVIFIICLMFAAQTVHATYMTTATSISWSGAYASIADGLEATLYNPAGVAMSSHKVGLNILGSYSFRFYNNSLSTKDIINVVQKGSEGENMTDYFHDILNFMPSYGFDTGLEMSLLNFMSFFKFKHFSLGISVLPKTKLDMTLSKSFFTTLMDKISLAEGSSLSMNASLSMLQYFDFNGSISTRVKFLEKVIPVDAIYAGASMHVYIPTAFMSVVLDDISVSSFKWDNMFGFLGYNVHFSGKSKMAMNKAISDNIYKFLPDGKDEDGKQASTNWSELVQNSGTVGFGLGFDMGTIVQVKKWVRVGFSVTDLGFISFPQSVEVDVSTSADLTIDLGGDNAFGSMGSFTSSIMDGFTNGLGSGVQNVQATFFMPDTAIRLGVAFTPVVNKFIEITAAADISVTDLNKCINGNVPTFNFATGVEVLPRLGWFEFVFRTAFCYNSEANNPAFSFGTGLHLGALQMEIGVKGLEVLIENWGAKEVIVGLDCKFVF